MSGGTIMMSNAKCHKCQEIEPQEWDFKSEGLWICNCSKSIDKEKFDAILEKLTKD
jgi:hypothetical protein